MSPSAKRKWAILLFGAGAAWIVWLVTRPVADRPVERIRFVGFTNGVVTPLVASFSKLSSNQAAVMQSWLDDGTNAALFAVTNRQSYPIEVLPMGVMYTREWQTLRPQTPLLGPAGWVLVAPSQVATVQVAVLPHHGPWKIELEYCYYAPDPMPLWLRRIMNFVSPPTRARVLDSEKMESDWIEK